MLSSTNKNVRESKWDEFERKTIFLRTGVPKDYKFNREELHEHYS